MKTRQWMILAMVIGTLLIIAMDAWAGEPVGRRQAKQSRRIAQGVRSGQITDREYSRLSRDQGRIQQQKVRAWADGDLNCREKRRLSQMQDRAGHHIYGAKHNRSRQGTCRYRQQSLHFSKGPAYDKFAVRVSGVFGEPCWSLGWGFIWR
jgi:hypothetical protein